MKKTVDIADDETTPRVMNDLNAIIRAALAPPNDPPVSYLARTYGLSRQGLYKVCTTHGMETSTFECPENVFIILTQKGKRSPLRTRLADPAEQARIKSSIKKYYDDQTNLRILANRATA